MNRYLLTIIISLITITSHAQIVETNGKRSINDVPQDTRPPIIIMCSHKTWPIPSYPDCKAEDTVLVSSYKPLVFKLKDGSWQIEFLP